MATLNIKPIKDRTLRANVVEQLREAIINGDLPPGTQLVELQLSKLLGVSRGPLREAIRELVDQGLIENIPYTGTYVSSITIKKIDELYTFRTQLERFAFTLLWPNKSQQFIDELQHQKKRLLRAIEDNDSSAAITEELELHNTVYRHCDHELLQENWYRLKGRLHFYFTLHQKAHHRSGPYMHAHDEYVDLACGDDLEAMLAHVDSHMTQGYDKVKQLVTTIEEQG
ncbi:MAG: GntR family transcriptional regulator [Pseudomonadales bacterium]